MRIDERGQILYTAVLVMMVTLSMLLFTGVSLHQRDQARVQQWAYHGMAINMAHAGIVESLSWLRRNPNASRYDGNARVFEFTDFSSDPADGETRENDVDQPYFMRTPLTTSNGNSWITPASLNPYIGIVKEFNLSKDLYGRFEVWDDDLEDITQQGELWRVRSIGMLIRKDNADDNFHGVLGTSLTNNDSPSDVWDEVKADANKVDMLASVMISTEFRRLNIKIPVAAMLISAHRGSWISLNNRVRLIGPGNQGSAIQYAPSTGSASTSGTVEIQGFNENRTDHAGSEYDTSMAEIFGVDKKTLAALSDINAENFSQLPQPLPDMKLVYLAEDATFDTANPLQGSGIIFVDGDVTLTGTGHSYSGLIVCTGSFTNTAISTIFGSIIAGLDYDESSTQTAISLSGVGADFSEFYYDPEILNDVATQLGVYRIARSPSIERVEVQTADGLRMIPRTWLYGFDREGDANKNRTARLWLPPEYP